MVLLMVCSISCLDLPEIRRLEERRADYQKHLRDAQRMGVPEKVIQRIRDAIKDIEEKIRDLGEKYPKPPPKKEVQKSRKPRKGYKKRR